MIDQNSYTIDTGEHKTPGVLMFEGKRYAVGLIWFTADDEVGNSLLNVRRKMLKPDFYCLRNAISAQQGFGFLEKGHRMGMPAAAAQAADQLVGEWHGVFEADNGWLYLAVHNDAIAPNGDVFFESEEEAYNYFLSQLNNHNWPRSYAPKSWNIPDLSGEITLDKLFDEVGQTALRPAHLDALLGDKGRSKIAATLGAIILGLIILIVVVQSVLPSLIPDYRRDANNFIEAPDIIKPPPKIVAARQAARLAAENIEVEQPRPSAMIALCTQAVEKIMVPLPGWQLRDIACTSQQAVATWSRGIGNLDLLQQHIADFSQDAQISFDGQNAFKVGVPLGSLAPFMRKETLLKRDPAILAINKRFGNLGRLSVVYTEPAPEAGERRGGVTGLLESAPILRIPPFLRITLATRTPPHIIANYFDIQGLVIDDIKWDYNSKTWEYKARVIIDTDSYRDIFIEQRQREAGSGGF